MPEFAVLVHPRVWKELRDLERAGQRETAVRIREAIEQMRRDPFTPRPGFDTKPKTGEREGIRRVRIGNYRVFYDADQGSRMVHVLRISHRGVAYRS